MKNLNILLEKVDTLKLTGNPEIEISSIQYDSRKCTEGSLFIALRGTKSDGHDFIGKAIQNGAIAIVCEKFPETLSSENLTIIQVANTRETLAVISHTWFDEPTKNMRVIGVTGTNGKTTITFIMKSLFEAFGEMTGIIGTTGIFFAKTKIEATHTTPESLELAGIFRLMKDAGVRNVIMEVSSHALHQHRADCINFDSALFTNLTHDHLDYHQTMEEYAKSKKILFDMLTQNSTAMVFDNSPFSDFMISDTKATHKYLIGRTERSDIKITRENLDLFFSSYNLTFSKNTLVDAVLTDLKTKLVGRFNIDNSAICLAWFLLKGYSPEMTRAFIGKANGAPGRMQRIKMKNGAVALVDYAHTPDALEKALLSCRDILITAGKKDSKLISVFGCGGDRDKTKRPIMGQISSQISDISIVTSDNPRTENPEAIIDDIYSGISSGLLNKTHRIPNRHKAIEFAVRAANSGDIILVAGKGHENYQIIGIEKTHFDDCEELEKLAG